MTLGWKEDESVSVLQLSTDASETQPDQVNAKPGQLVQAIFELLAEGAVKFNWHNEVDLDRGNENGRVDVSKEVDFV